MSNENAELIRHAYQAYANGDLDAMLELVTSNGELVMVGVRTPGVDAHHGRQEALQVVGVRP